MSCTTVGVFSFWPTSSTSPGFASGWLAPTTRLMNDGPLQGRPPFGTRSSASPNVTTAWWRWWLTSWRQGARASSTRPARLRRDAPRRPRRAAASPRPRASRSTRCRSGPGGPGRRRRWSARARRTPAAGRPAPGRAAASRSSSAGPRLTSTRGADPAAVAIGSVSSSSGLFSVAPTSIERVRPASRPRACRRPGHEAAAGCPVPSGGFVGPGLRNPPLGPGAVRRSLLGRIAPAGIATSPACGGIRVTSVLPAAAPLPRLPARARSPRPLRRGRAPGVALAPSRVAAAPAVAAPAPAAAPLPSAPRPRHQPLPKIIATLGSAGSTLSVTASPVANGADG